MMLNIADAHKIKLQSVLDSLGIKSKCTNVEVNKHLAFFDIELEPGTSIKKVESSTMEIALGIRSKGAPIVKPIPERGIVRLQVAMRKADHVTLESLYAGYSPPKDYMLPIILGESDQGEKVIIDLAKNPHTIISGGTGSGKSVLLHNIIANLLYLNAMQARAVDLYLIDPKLVEFEKYSSGVLSRNVVKCIQKYDAAVELLESIEQEMENRYIVLKTFGLRSVEECKAQMPQIVVIIDEYADLMQQDKATKKLQNTIVRLAQKARAAGIYLILGTQRPSVDVITGLIKANFPARIACKTASKTDSLVILDSVGAENLMGRGDAIINAQSFDRVRFQVAFSDPKNTEHTLKTTFKLQE